jgi:hypothetical protein
MMESMISLRILERFPDNETMKETNYEVKNKKEVRKILRKYKTIGDLSNVEWYILDDDSKETKQ